MERMTENNGSEGLYQLMMSRGTSIYFKVDWDTGIYMLVYVDMLKFVAT